MDVDGSVKIKMMVDPEELKSRWRGLGRVFDAFLISRLADGSARFSGEC